MDLPLHHPLLGIASDQPSSAVWRRYSLALSQISFLGNLCAGDVSFTDGYRRAEGNDLVDFAEPDNRDFVLWDIAA
jgi:hypothetical protein